jgi:DNA-binding transcriptional LysR family regulator
MDRLMTMMAFTRVVQSESFSAAALELGISRALVSRYIADLEAHVGVRLLNRTTRYVRPTELGQAYCEFCNKILTEIRVEEESLTRTHKGIEGRISVACPKWIGFSALPDALTAFCTLYPRVNCDLTLIEVSPRSHNFLEHGYDLALLTRPIRDSRIKVKKLADISYVLAATPQYLAEHGRPEHPQDLRKHACLVQVSDPIWSFDNGRETIAIKPHSRFTSNTYTVLARAALGGLGIAALPSHLALPHVLAGQLELVLEKFSLDDRSLYAAFTPGVTPPQKVRSLIAFLSDWFIRHPLKPALAGRLQPHADAALATDEV